MSDTFILKHKDEVLLTVIGTGNIRSSAKYTTLQVKMHSVERPAFDLSPAAKSVDALFKPFKPKQLLKDLACALILDSAKGHLKQLMANGGSWETLFLAIHAFHPSSLTLNDQTVGSLCKTRHSNCMCALELHFEINGNGKLEMSWF